MGYAEFEWLRRRMTKEMLWIPEKQTVNSINFAASNEEILIASHNMVQGKKGKLRMVLISGSDTKTPSGNVTLKLYDNGQIISSVTGEIGGNTAYTNKPYIGYLDPSVLFYGGSDSSYYRLINGGISISTYSLYSSSVICLPTPVSFSSLDIKLSCEDATSRNLMAQYMIDEVDA